MLDPRRALHDVLPGFSGHDAVHRAGGDAVSGSERALRHARRAQGANFSHDVIGQDRGRIPCPAREPLGMKARTAPVSACTTFGMQTRAIPVALGRMVPALALPVRHVVGMCPEPQMGRSDTSPIVAMVQDEQPVRDGSVSQYPRVSVTTLSATIDGEAAVPAPFESNQSRPAGAKLGAMGRDGSILLDMRPKTLNRRHPAIRKLAGIPASSRAEVTRNPGRMRRTDAVSGSAPLACAIGREGSTGVDSGRHRSTPSVSTSPAAPPARGHLASPLYQGATHA